MEDFDISKIVVGEFDTPRSLLDSSTREKLSKVTLVLKEEREEMGLADTRRAYNPPKVEFTFSRVHKLSATQTTCWVTKDNFIKFRK